MLRAFVTFAILLALTACNRDQYRVVEREPRYLDKHGLPVSSLQAQSFDHAGVHYVLKHGGHKIYADCEIVILHNPDELSSCELQPLREYECVLGTAHGVTGRIPYSDLTCKNDDGQNVYLFVTKEE